MSGTTTPAYEFDADMQTELTSLCMWDHDFLKRTDGLIRPEYFESDVERGFVRIALDFYAKYREAPTATAWVQLVKDAYASKPAMWRDDQKADVVGKLGATQKLTVRSRAFLMDKAAEFARQQAITQAMLAGATELGKTHDPERFDRIQEGMTKALKIGLREGEDEYDFWVMVEQRAADRVDIAKGAKPKIGIPTGIPELDTHLKHGGWGRKELSLYMGAAKAGKSFNLTSAAAAANMLGYNVLFVTLENAKGIQADRIEANISDVGMSDFATTPSTVEAIMQAKRKGLVGKFIIREFPMMSFRPRDLENLVDEYHTKGIIFDLVVIDYLDIMVPDQATDSNIENSKQVYGRCRGIAQKEGFALLSATQTNREGAKAATAGMTHVAEDFNRIRIADLVISINRTDEERVNSKARLYIAAARNQRDGVTFFVRQDLDKGKAVAEVENVE